MVYRAEISAILAYFWPHLVAMATALAPLKIQIAHLKFADLNNPTAHEKNGLTSCTELKSVQFWPILAQIWLPWQLPLIS